MAETKQRNERTAAAGRREVSDGGFTLTAFGGYLKKFALHAVLSINNCSERIDKTGVIFRRKLQYRRLSPNRFARAKPALKFHLSLRAKCSVWRDD
jgi:hypothetical protein